MIKSMGLAKIFGEEIAQAVTQSGFPRPAQKQNRDAVGKSIVRFFYNINTE